MGGNLVFKIQEPTLESADLIDVCARNDVGKARVVVARRCVNNPSERYTVGARSSTHHDGSFLTSAARGRGGPSYIW